MIGLNGNLFMKNLTFAPQPKWKHIAKAIFATDKSDEKIIQHWSLNNKKTFRNYTEGFLL